MLSELSLRDRTLLALGINFGFRVSEMLSLRVKDVYDIDNDCVRERVYLQKRNRKGKTEGKSQLINKNAKKYIEQYIKDIKPLPTDYLFKSTQSDKAITRQWAWKIMSDVAKKIGLTGKVGTHSWRKTFAHRVFDVTGENLVKTQIALGHKSINSTISYLDAEREEIDNAIRKI